MVQVFYLDLKFQHALFVVGAALIIFGIAFGLATAGQPQENQGALDAVSKGFSFALVAMFTGILSGVGATLVIGGLLLRLKGKTRILAAMAFLLVCLLIAISSIAEAPGATFATLSLFFAGLAASGAFLLTAVIFALSGAIKDYVSDQKNNKPQTIGSKG